MNKEQLKEQSIKLSQHIVYLQLELTAASNQLLQIFQLLDESDNTNTSNNTPIANEELHRKDS